MSKPTRRDVSNAVPVLEFGGRRPRSPRGTVAGAWAILAAAAALFPTVAEARQEMWKLDNLERIGGRTIEVEGQPRVIRWRGGSAIEFDGVRDSLFVPGRPLVGAGQFTIEVEIRPDGGAFEQKFLHIAETDPATGRDVRPVGSDHDANHRIMFELRAVEGGIYTDAFLKSPAGNTAIAPTEKLHAAGQWHVFAQTFDGTTYRSYVDGVLQGEATFAFTPQGPGNVRIGARMEKVAHFKGAIARIRFTDRALPQSALLKARGGARKDR